MSELSGVVRLDLELSDEILSVIPTDPFEQLNLAKKITSMAIASKVSTLEAEVIELRQKLQEMEMCTHELESKAYRYERDIREADSRFKIVLHDNMNLTKERDSLTTTVTNLNREMAKLETFKRKLVQSLSNDDEIAPPQTDSVDIKTYDQSVPLSYPDKSVDMTHHPVEEAVPIYTGPRFSVSPWLTPQTNSTAGSPKARTSGWYPSTSSQQSSAANSTPRGLPLQAPRTPRIDGKEFFRQQTDSVDIKTYDQSVPLSYPDKSVDMTHHPVEEAVPIYTGPRFSVSPWLTPQTNSTAGSPKARTSGWYPSTSSQQSSAANSTPRGLPLQAPRTPRIDGKEFFRQVRSRLSYEQFKAFLATIKELNAQRQTREETLRKADEIFGTENKDLYLSMQGFLNKNKS
ncbi:PREDICTED: uncharacterized protein At4g15545-like [Camelina sativa]|uniref:Uncharacterized protein At4g15545-like n=1 Tax=Camelina sativa TaxID=90675 RepID=A0ABM1Q7I8_CAMSA|nr:PREDICTED: uncharacterized protein At4g15545-like [Camelina sativa]